MCQCFYSSAKETSSWLRPCWQKFWIEMSLLLEMSGCTSSPKQRLGSSVTPHWCSLWGYLGELEKLPRWQLSHRHVKLLNVSVEEPTGTLSHLHEKWNWINMDGKRNRKTEVQWSNRQKTWSHSGQFWCLHASRYRSKGSIFLPVLTVMEHLGFLCSWCKCQWKKVLRSFIGTFTFIGLK